MVKWVLASFLAPGGILHPCAKMFGVGCWMRLRVPVDITCTSIASKCIGLDEDDVEIKVTYGI